MAISLTTGLPGHGKTLRTIVEVEERRVSEGRRVYQHGIPELTLDWFELEDPRKWYELPEGSLIIIDEAQKVFPVRPSGSAVPKHVSEFETHRHRGLDIVLITQHPNLIDAHVRKLVERHQHVMRPFGHSYAVVFEWQVCTDPNRSGVQKQALKSRWRYPKKAFEYYKSASKHTVKKRLPGKVILLPILGAALGILLFIAKSTLNKPQAQEPQHMEPSVSAEAISGLNPVGIKAQGVRSGMIKRQPEPFEGYTFYAAGTLNNETLISADQKGRSLVLRASELKQAGYLVEVLSPCIVRLGYRTSIYYATCRPSASEAVRGAMATRQEGRKDGIQPLEGLLTAATGARG